MKKKLAQKARQAVKAYRLEVPRDEHAPSDHSSVGDESDVDHLGHGPPREAKPLPSLPLGGARDKFTRAVNQLIDELRVLNHLGEAGRAAREGDRIDREEYQRREVDKFFAFEKRLATLDKGLVTFHNAVRHLGSSVGIVLSAQKLRTSFEEVRLALRLKSTVAFPFLKADMYKKHKRLGYAQVRGPAQTDISLCLESLADGLEHLLTRINEIAEFEEEGMNTCVEEFLVDLRFWADYLREFPGELTPSNEVSIYIHDLAEPMGSHVDAFTKALASFVEHGVPTIRFGQEQAGVAYQNLSTVSTLLCAVTATTIQFVYTNSKTALQQGVIILWILSLMFSIASAINAQLAYHWTVTRVRSPRKVMPWIIRMVITRVPLHFLICSVIAFSAGLVCFSYSTFPHTVIPAITTAGTAVTLTALVFVLLWLAAERWVSYYSQSEEWLTIYAQGLLEKIVAWIARRRGPILPGPDAGDGHIPLTPVPVPMANGTHDHPVRPSIAGTVITENDTVVLPSGVASDRTEPMPFSPQLVPPTAAKDALVRLEFVRVEHEDTAPVRHLAFSPDGSHLASCGGEEQVLLWKEEQDTLKVFRTLKHDAGTVLHLCWSPNGEKLLGRTRSKVLLWNLKSSNDSAHTLLSRLVSAVRWMPDDESIIIADGPDASVLFLDGKEKQRYEILPHGGSTTHVKGAKINDIAVTSDGRRIVISATKKVTARGIDSSRVNFGRQLIVYNLNDQKIEHVMPIVHKTRGVTLSLQGKMVLVTYEHEKKTPEVLKWVSTSPTGPCRLEFSHPCSPRKGVKTVGLSSIGAVWGNTQEDQLVFCATNDRLCWWDGKSGRFLSATTPVSPEISEFTSAAWNHGASNVSKLWVVAGLMSGGLALYKPKPADVRVTTEGSEADDGSPK